MTEATDTTSTLANDIPTQTVNTVQGDLIASILERSRQSLLDLSLRNRLLNVPKQSKNARLLHVHDEISAEIYRLLVSEGRSFSFLHGKTDKHSDSESPEEAEAVLAQPEEGDEDFDERGVAARHRDTKLQTSLTSEGLQKRLLAMYYDAKTFEEEQGVNILFLTLGMLSWYESDSSDKQRFSPLLLVPVELERSTAGERFKLKWRGDEISANLSLQAKMNAEFGIAIPDLKEADDIDIEAYMDAVEASIKSQPRFSVERNDITVGFFSFAKFLMYRDLAPENWPESISISKHPIITGVLNDGFPANDDMLSEDAHIDEHVHPKDMFHVLDADGSQTLAIEEVRRGRNMVIQGPPGTGKSQTITNIITAAVAEGKKVLFVAEKMAALDVVHRRLESVGVGPICLELHSHKANKRQVLEELKSTLELGRPRGDDQGRAVRYIEQFRKTLNKHASQMHREMKPAQLTPYQIIGQSLRLKEAGISASGVDLDNPANWTPDEKADRILLLEDIAARLTEMGSISRNPWNGVKRSALLPSEEEKLKVMLDELCEVCDRTLKSAHFIESILELGDAASIAELKNTLAAAKSFEALPSHEAGFLASEKWVSKFSRIKQLQEDGQQHFNLKTMLSPKLNDAAWDTDLTECRQHIATYGGSFLSFMRAPYRQAKKLLSSIMEAPLPKEHEAQLTLVDGIIKAKKLGIVLNENREFGEEVYGELWAEQHTEWDKTLKFVEWREALPKELVSASFLQKCATIVCEPELIEHSKELDKSLPQLRKAANQIITFLELDLSAAFNADVFENVAPNQAQHKFHTWHNHLESLSKWVGLHARLNEASAMGMEGVVDFLIADRIVAPNLMATFERAYYDALTEKVFDENPDLRAFDGDQHQQLVEQFKENDLQRIYQAQIQVAGIHYAGIPKSEGGTGALGVLKGELAKKRKHLPIRQLLKRAGPAIQAIKPVFMMSPMSIAQFLEPGCVDFDLLLIDEASQVEPVDALGAIARAKQIVVVGDSKQLPPTRFFSSMTGDDDEPEDKDEYNISTKDIESILAMCLAKGLPERMLRWHYRSKHQSLIAVSNKEFYENKLFIVPSPYDQAAGMGLHFNLIKDGVFDSGGTATNANEAKAVAMAVMTHAMEHPELSLGVGAFSVKQRQAILDEVELLRRANPDAEAFFQSHPHEPFFVKNLENIQGDERDVIFISVGYGKNKQGYMAMRFGPLSSEGGERRMNVLISRAKRRCEVFSSIVADDIDLNRARGAGVAALKLFLKFAETGQLDFARDTDREMDSEFEEQVAAALRSRGYGVKAQIGSAGFFVDLGVLDPDKPGRFVLGIECDGAAYHSSRSARDRDRLRQAVLEAHGWIIHRIWSTDWFRRPQEQLEKTIAAIEAAKKLLNEEQYTPSKGSFQINTLDREDVIEVSAAINDNDVCQLYKEASFAVDSRKQPHEVTDVYMADVVANIVLAESPIHESEIVTRVRELWGLQRAGSRIKSKVEKALKAAQRIGALERDGEFYSTPHKEVLVRDRSATSSPGLKKPENLPPSEIRAAILKIVSDNFGADRHSLAVEVARLFGFQNTSAQLRSTIETESERMIREELLSLSDDTLLLKAA
jgi:very-short-patch-repair endonuclease